MSRVEKIRDKAALAGNVVDVCKRMGPEWVLFRFRYAAERKLGLHERRSPARPWPLPGGLLEALPAVVDAAGLSRWLQGNASAEQRAHAEQTIADLSSGRFDVFGNKVELDSWHADPLHKVVYDESAHWSSVPEFERVDVKCVWEPNRFTWAFDLARAELIDDESGAANLFWELLADWMKANPPNLGINWACGQEASIRVMSVLLTAMALEDSQTPERLGMLEQLLEVTADRVEANIDYARSQRNNHQASEAVLLVVASLLLPSHRNTGGWREAGLRNLNEVATKLILPDGGSSQYSTNYHRVFVHNLLWVSLVAESCSFDLGVNIRDALRRASDYLINFMEPISGSGPFIGHDDGAELLPRFAQAHRLLGPDVQLLRAYQDLPPASGPAEWNEWLAWFGLEFGSAAPRELDEGPGFLHYPNMGMVIMWAGKHRAYVRCGPFDFRPSQADQLHVDIWENGVNTVGDPGTFSYNPGPGEPGLLDSAFDHNTITIDGKDHMPKVGRFLFARWVEGSVSSLSTTGQNTSCTARLDLPNGHIERTISISRDGVVDSLQDTNRAERKGTPRTDHYRQLSEAED